MSRNAKTRYVPGDYNVISDISGLQFKRSEMRFTWDKLLVHHTEWEPKHPQLTLRPKKDSIAVKDARVRTTDQTLQDPSITEDQMI